MKLGKKNQVQGSFHIMNQHPKRITEHADTKRPTGVITWSDAN